MASSFTIKDPVAVKVMRLTTPLTETAVSGSEPKWAAALSDLTQFAQDWKWKATEASVPVAKLLSLSTAAYQLPLTGGQIFSGEDFRAYLNVCNQQPVVRDSLQVSYSVYLKLKIEVWKEGRVSSGTSTRGLIPVSTVYETEEPVFLQPHEFHDLIFSVRLSTSGSYSIICHCECEPRRCTLGKNADPSPWDDSKCVRFRRIYKLLVEDPFIIEYHNYPLTSDNKVICELSLTSNNESGSLNVQRVEILPSFPKSVSINHLSNERNLIFDSKNDRKIYLFEVVMQEHSIHQLVELFQNPLGMLQLEWRHQASYQKGVSDPIPLLWGDDVIASLCASNNVPIEDRTDDLIEQPSLFITIKSCPNECKVGEPFTVTYTVKNVSILEEARMVRIQPAESNDIEHIGVFPLILKSVPSSASIDVKTDFVSLKEGVLDLPLLRVTCEAWRSSPFISRGLLSVVSSS